MTDQELCKALREVTQHIIEPATFAEAADRIEALAVQVEAFADVYRFAIGRPEATALEASLHIGSLIANLRADAVALTKERDEAQREHSIAEHGLLLISDRVGDRGTTDCSTPLHIAVQNIVERADRAEAVIAGLKAWVQSRPTTTPGAVLAKLAELEGAK